jgi:molecular chaperone HtpG
MIEEIKIPFQVETSRILQILANDIYDSPYALLRENVQNAYDAVLMRTTSEGTPITNRSIQIVVEPSRLVVIDDGIGMEETVVRENFWKAGSSGKKGDLAQKAGVVGTFGIGAMANFGVCRQLTVETRALGSAITLKTSAIVEELSFNQDCIRLERLEKPDQPIGTTLIADLQDGVSITAEQVRAYLEPFVRFLRVPVTINGTLVSQVEFSTVFLTQLESARRLEPIIAVQGEFSASVEVFAGTSGSVSVHIREMTYAGQPVSGEMFLVQGSGSIMGYRNSFGLALVPIGSNFQFGGAMNVATLRPTAGRDSLTQESIQQMQGYITLIEQKLVEIIATTDLADSNTYFQNYIYAYGRTDLAVNISIEALPEVGRLALKDVAKLQVTHGVMYYLGRDQSIMDTYATTSQVLLNVSQTNPRRELQHRYLTQILRVEQVPDTPTVLRRYGGRDLERSEIALMSRIITILSDDYSYPNVDIEFADLSHGVEVFVEGNEEHAKIYLARQGSIVRPVLECYKSAQEVFGQFAKDFVRVNLFPKLQSWLPSSTRQGAEALLKTLQRKRELYRYEETDYGELDSFFMEYLEGTRSFPEVLRAATAAQQSQTQQVTLEQVGNIEERIPNIVDPTASAQPISDPQFGGAPPILRSDVSIPLKLLLASNTYAGLNNFTMFLGLSDRLFNRYSEFFFEPHTTRVIWAAHRIIYVFTHASGNLTMYYDIEVKDPMDNQAANGSLLPTTTLITKDRIFIPIPNNLLDVFRVTSGPKEFFIRFDVI